LQYFPISKSVNRAVGVAAQRCNASLPQALEELQTGMSVGIVSPEEIAPRRGWTAVHSSCIRLDRRFEPRSGKASDVSYEVRDGSVAGSSRSMPCQRSGACKSSSPELRTFKT
jgi:hypothetical protein